MTKQGEIWEGLKTIILMNVETNALGDIVFKVDGLSKVFAYLHSQGVAIKREREFPIITKKGYYYLVESLIKEE